MNVAVRNMFNSDPSIVRRINLNITKARKGLKELGILDPECLDSILNHIRVLLAEVEKH